MNVKRSCFQHHGLNAPRKYLYSALFPSVLCKQAIQYKVFYDSGSSTFVNFGLFCRKKKNPWNAFQKPLHKSITASPSKSKTTKMKGKYEAVTGFQHIHDKLLIQICCSQISSLQQNRLISYPGDGEEHATAPSSRLLCKLFHILPKCKRLGGLCSFIRWIMKWKSSSMLSLNLLRWQHVENHGHT